MNRYPDAQDVAIAIAVACRLVGEDPLEVMAGKYGSRARHYAARAIEAECPRDEGPGGYGRVDIARWCGLKYRSAAYSFFAGFDFRMRNGGISWWNEETFELVKAAIRASEPAKHPKPKFRLVDDLVRVRPEAAKARGCMVMIPGDPPPYRSALFSRVQPVDQPEEG